MLREGQRVSFVGHPGPDGPEIGDEGKVLALAGRGCHVLWGTGKHGGAITLVSNDDLVGDASLPQPHHVGTVLDSLSDGVLMSEAVREAHDRGGVAGLFQALAEEGHLSGLAPVAEEAQSLVASRIRQDESMGYVLSQLEPDEGDALVALAASTLLRDALAEEE